MKLSNRDKIQILQNEMLQVYFEEKMVDAFKNNWKTEIDKKLKSKSQKDIKDHHVYKDLLKIFKNKGVNKIGREDFDVTALTALIKYDFSNQCIYDKKTQTYIDKIRNDRNTLSHITNWNNTSYISVTEIQAINNMIDFLNYLFGNSRISSSIFDEYVGIKNNGKLHELLKEVKIEEKYDDDYYLNIVNYLQKLRTTRDERINEYIPLSYNSEGNLNEKFSLDELINLNLEVSKKGIRIVAEGGYGKSWTLAEIAGRYAENFFNSNTPEKESIPILIEAGNLYNDCSSINKTIAKVLFDGDETKVIPFLKEKSIILFVDAMDEATTTIQGQLSRELSSLKSDFENIRFVCASRKSCIDKYPISIPLYVIKELDDEQIINFLEKSIPEEMLDKAKNDWVGDNKKMFLYNTRTPFYINCYIQLINETNDHDFTDTTQLIEKFLNSVIEREIKKTGFNSDRDTFINFLKEFNRLLNLESVNGEKVLSLPENDVLVELSDKIKLEDGQASLKEVCRKLVQIQLLSKEDISIFFAHQNYKDYIERKYGKKYRKWS